MRPAPVGRRLRPCGAWAEAREEGLGHVSAGLAALRAVAGRQAKKLDPDEIKQRLARIAGRELGADNPAMRKKPLAYGDLADFVRLYNPANRHDRVASWSDATPEGRWRAYSREDLLARDKASLDLFWLTDKSLTDPDNLPEPDDLAEDIIENLEALLQSLRSVLASLRPGA